MFSGLRHKKFISICLSLSFFLQTAVGYAQQMPLPAVGQRLALSAPVQTPSLMAVTFDPKNSLKFSFFVSKGTPQLSGEELKASYSTLVKDFFTALTIPENDLWVNLSPLERDRMIDARFGLTDMGRDLLAQDYILKQVTASLLYPDEGVGRDFWAEIYRRAAEQFGTTDIPVDTFNKVWITPDVAEVYQQGTTGAVKRHHLKVQLESDYMSSGPETPEKELAKKVMRQVVIPVIEKEVNEGANFARLHQIYNALILAAWFKKTVRESFISRVYVDKSRVKGIEQKDPQDNLKIYAQYVEGFRKGAFNFVREDVERNTGEMIPRKYFSGGITLQDFAQKVLSVISDASEGIDDKSSEKVDEVAVALESKEGQGKPKSTTYRDIPTPTPDLAKTLIAKIKTKARALAKLKESSSGLYGKNETQANQIEAELPDLAKKAFKEYISSEPTAEALIEIFDNVVDDTEYGGLKALIFSGTYTMEVFKQFRNLALMVRQDDNIPYAEVLPELGLSLNSELMGKFQRIVESFKTEDDYKGFYLKLKAVALTLDQKDNVYRIDEDEYDKTKLLEAIRQQGDGFSVNKDDVKNFIKWLKDREDIGHDLFDLSIRVVRGVRGLLGISEDSLHLIFSRLKDTKSLKGKLTNKKDPKEPYGIYDYFGARIAFSPRSGLIEISKAINSVLNYSVRLEKYLKNMEFEINKVKFELKTQKGLLASQVKNKNRVDNKISSEVKRLELELLKIEQAKSHFESSRPILVRYRNYNDDDEKWWYNAAHFIFMLGRRSESIEVQFKTLITAILHDMEHKIGYKKKSQDVSSLHKTLMRLIFLRALVEPVNFIYLKDKSKIRSVLDWYIEDNKLDNAQSFSQQVSRTDQNGGIDVRDVEHHLNVSGSNNGARLELEPEAFPVDDSTGFQPVILSITPVESLPVR